MQRGAAPQVESTSTQTMARTPAAVPANRARTRIRPFLHPRGDRSVRRDRMGHPLGRHRQREGATSSSSSATSRSRGSGPSRPPTSSSRSISAARSARPSASAASSSSSAASSTRSRRGRVKQKYFASEDDLQAFSDDLKHLLVYQKAAFNSPVWFNVGFEKAPAVLGVLHQLGAGHDGVDPRPGEDRGDAVQVRIRARARTCRRSARRASCSPAAARRRARCRS